MGVITDEKARRCPRCRRTLQYDVKYKCPHGPVTETAVLHSEYGCDTGCCGHNVVAYDADGNECHEEWHFDHPSFEEMEKDRGRAWAQSLADQDFRGVPLNWIACRVGNF